MKGFWPFFAKLAKTVACLREKRPADLEFPSLVYQQSN